MYSDFVFLDRFLFELSCKNTHTHKHGTHTHTHTHTHTETPNTPYSCVLQKPNYNHIEACSLNSSSGGIEILAVEVLIRKKR